MAVNYNGKKFYYIGPWGQFYKKALIIYCNTYTF